MVIHFANSCLVLRDGEVRVVSDPSQAEHIGDLIALDQHRRDRTTIEELYMERERRQKEELKRMKQEHGDQMLDLFGPTDTEPARDKLPTTPPAARSAPVRRPTHTANSTPTSTPPRARPSPWAPRIPMSDAKRPATTSARSSTATASGLKTSVGHRPTGSTATPSTAGTVRAVNSSDKRQDSSLRSKPIVKSAPTVQSGRTAQPIRAGKHAREESDDYESEEESDYVSDDGFNYSSEISRIFGYNPRR
jgi:hypothetical protein